MSALLIIDTDMGVDVDDAGMLCAAHALQDNGEATILAVVHDLNIDTGVGAISAINNYYVRSQGCEPPARPVLTREATPAARWSQNR